MLLDRETRALVEGGAFRRAELLVEGVADQRVGEGIATVAQIGDQPLGDRLGRRSHQLLWLHVGDPPDQLLLEVPADHRGDTQCLIGPVAEAIEAPADHLPNALRDLQLRRVTAAGQLALAGEQPDDLADEERIAVRLLVDGLGQAHGRRGAGGHLDVTLDTPDREALERYAPAPLDAGDLAEHPGERMVAPSSTSR